MSTPHQTLPLLISHSNGGNLDRLPTLSASQALNKQKSQNRHISTGSRVLDNLLADCSYGSNPPPPPRGFTKRLVVPRDFGDFGAENRHDEGIGKGKLTEVCGPPGSGKTAFGYGPSRSE